jgi:hypothetical protein
MKYIATIALFFMSGSSYGQPSNDECTNAAVIPATPTFPYTNNVTNIFNAVENPADPVLSCFSFGGPDTFSPSPTPSFSLIKKTVWYAWTPDASGSYDFSTAGSMDNYENFTYSIFPVIGLFEGPTCDAINEITCSATFLSTFILEQGKTYYVMLLAELFGDSGANLVLTVYPTPPPPSNDECVNATVIPSSPTFPYTTVAVEISKATENLNDPFLSCSFFGGDFIDLSGDAVTIGGDVIDLTGDAAAIGVDSATLAPTISPTFNRTDGKTVWYIWTPAVSGSYDFSTVGSVDLFESEIFTLIGVFEGDTCDAAEEIACSNAKRVRGTELEGGKTYLIKVGAYADADVGGQLILTVKPTPPPPSNDECINAITIDPSSGEIITGDTSDAFLDRVRENTCGTDDAASGVWYKFTSGPGSTPSIIASTCNEGTTYDTKLSVFKGNDCDALECVGTVDDSNDQCSLTSKLAFLTAELTTYWILVHGFGSSTGNYTLTIDSIPNFLTLIDAKTDVVIEVLGDYIDYQSVQSSSSKLNIQATFSEDVPVESVRVTFDNPKRSFCEEKAPYSIFGDSNGKYYDVTIPLGTHLVTATSYAQAGCAGSAGIALAKTVEVIGCYISYNVYNVSDGSYYTILEYSNGQDSYELSGLPCEVNIEAAIYCSFVVGVTRLELRNTATNQLVTARNEREAPYFLFGNDNSRIFSGSIPSGSYSITANVDGIQHPSVNFTVIDACL